MGLTDFTYLESITGRDKEITEELVSVFIEQVPECISELNQAFEDKDYEALSSYAHKYKSTVVIIGLSETESRLKNLELSLKDGKKLDDETIKSEIDKIEEDLLVALDEVNDYLESL